MNNLNLPNSGTVNWGRQLNETIRRLSQNVEILTKKVNRNDVGEYLAFPYAGSGVVGKGAQIDINEGKLSFVGDIYIGGEYRKLYRDITLEKEVDGIVQSQFYNSYFYVYVYYDNVEDSLEIVIEEEKEFIVNELYILLGFLYLNAGGEITFTKQIFVAEKTAMQHIDEYYRRRVELLNTAITFDGQSVKFSNYKGTIYADGIGYATENYDIDQKTITDSQEMIKNVIAHLQDYMDNDTGLSTRKTTASPQESTVFYRVLYTLDENILVQYYQDSSDDLKNTYLGKTKLIEKEDFIKSLIFNNDIEDFRASGYVELFRGYSDDYSIIFKADNNGLIPMPRLNVWNGATGLVTFNALEFRNSQDVNNTITFGYNGNGGTQYIFPTSAADLEQMTILTDNCLLPEGVHFIIPSAKYFSIASFSGATSSSVLKLESNSLSLFTNQFAKPQDNGTYLLNISGINTITSGNFYTKILPEGITIFNNEEGSVATYSRNHLQIGATSLDASELIVSRIEANNIDIKENGSITYMSDKRHKTNIRNIETNNLNIVRNTPIVGFNYIGSNQPHIGLISQDLAKNLNDTEKECYLQIVEEHDIKDCLRLKETKLVYILWKALQEADKKIEELENRIASLE